MNQFTKNELEYIAEAIEMWFKDYDSDTPERIYLKVKSMINGYCEHSETKQNSEVDYILCCAKCDAFKGWV